MTAPEALAIVGPTASGKTALSLDVARRLGGEIISMDSRQVYRGMDIGTAKVTKQQQSVVPHHGIDLVEPDTRFGAGEFARHARRRIAEITARDDVPLLVGGTGFFLRALTNPIFREPELDGGRRAALQRFLESLDTPTLHTWLAALDPAAAERLADWGGRQRIIRTLELPLLTGHRLAWWQQNSPPEAEPLRPLVFVLDMPRDRLNLAINERVTEMVHAGLVDEVRGLVAAGFREGHPGMNATGYAELLPFLRGERPLEDSLEMIRGNTRAYARRQVTWFRHQLPDDAVWLDATLPRAQLADEIVAKWSATAG